MPDIQLQGGTLNMSVKKRDDGSYKVDIRPNGRMDAEFSGFLKRKQMP